MANEMDTAREVALTAKTFAARHIEEIKGEVDNASPAFPDEIFALGVEAGFDKLALSEAAGGHGFGMLELVALVETLSKSCAGHAMVFGVHAAAMKTLADALGNDAQPLLERIYQSGRPIAVSMVEPASDGGFHSDLVVSEQGGEFVVPGGTPPAINAAPGAHLILFAKTTDDEPAVLLMEETDQLTLEPCLGLKAMPIAQVSFDNRIAPRSSIIAEGASALRLYRLLLGKLCTVTAAAASGIMRSACDQAYEYAAGRYQGAKMIIDHSHLRNILGAMSTSALTASMTVRQAASLKADDPAVLATKVKMTDNAVQTCTDAVQILGGYGYMKDYGLEKAMRDAAVLSLLPISNPRIELLIASLEKDRIV